jgi:G3E family GTPase
MSTGQVKKSVLVNLFSGFLGVGKTTALKHLIAHKPPHERWAVIVNEFGEIGIDGAALTQDELPVAEVAGGCLCCVAGPLMTATVVQLLRRARPDRLLIEASGLAHAAGVIDELLRPPLGNVLQMGATLTLVDPRQFIDPNYAHMPLYRDQVSIADVLVATKIDLADVETLQTFRQQAEALFPPKARIAEVAGGACDPVWLDLPPADKPRYRPKTPAGMPVEWQSQGYVFAAEREFDGEALTVLFDQLPQRVPGLMRAKGVFHVEGSWVWLNWADGNWGASEVAWRRDSRFELITGGPLDADAVRGWLEACLKPQKEQKQ